MYFDTFHHRQHTAPQICLGDDLTVCPLCLSVSGDPTDGPGGAKECQTVGDSPPPLLRSCPGYKHTMSYTASVLSHVDFLQSRQVGSAPPRLSQGALCVGRSSR